MADWVVRFVRVHGVVLAVWEVWVISFPSVPPPVIHHSSFPVRVFHVSFSFGITKIKHYSQPVAK